MSLTEQWGNWLACNITEYRKNMGLIVFIMVGEASKQAMKLHSQILEEENNIDRKTSQWKSGIKLVGTQNTGRILNW